jgi:hypothetical protein
MSQTKAHAPRPEPTPISDQKHPADLSPNLDMATFRNQLETVSALNLADLDHEMNCSLDELPLFAEASKHMPSARPILAWYMSRAFEAGRRYGLIIAGALMWDEIDAFAPHLTIDKEPEPTREIKPAVTLNQVN